MDEWEADFLEQLRERGEYCIGYGLLTRIVYSLVEAPSRLERKSTPFSGITSKSPSEVMLAMTFAPGIEL